MLVQLLDVRLGFHDLATAKSISGGKPKFSATMILSEDSEMIVTKADGSKARHPASKMSSVIKAVIKAKFPALPEKAYAKIKNWCWSKADGSVGAREDYTNDDGDYWDGFDEDTFYVTAAKVESKSPGGIRCYDHKRKLIPATDGRIYSGTFVNVIIDVYANDRDDGRTVSASLEGVQLLRRGDPLGFTAVDAATEFDEVESDEADDDLLDGSLEGSDDSDLGDDDDSGLGYDEDDIPF